MKVEPKYYTWHQDAALAICQTQGAICPHGCAKNGAPNCDYHVQRCECEPAKEAKRKHECWCGKFPIERIFGGDKLRGCPNFFKDGNAAHLHICVS